MYVRTSVNHKSNLLSNSCSDPDEEWRGAVWGKVDVQVRAGPDLEIGLIESELRA